MAVADKRRCAALPVPKEIIMADEMTDDEKVFFTLALVEQCVRNTGWVQRVVATLTANISAGV